MSKLISAPVALASVLSVLGCSDATDDLPPSAVGEVSQALCVSKSLSLSNARASSTENASLTADRAIDKNSSTRWSSAFSDPQWISVDLGSVVHVDRVKLKWEAAYSRHYQVQVSNDRVNWTTILETENGDGSIDDLSLLNASGRYLKVYSLERATCWGNSLWELEVFGDSDPACSRTAGDAPIPLTRSGDSGGWADIDNATDGDVGYGAHKATTTGTEFIDYDLGGTFTITRARLNEDNTGNWNVDDWNLQYWTGSTWADAFPFTQTPTGTWNEVDLADVTTDRVRVRMKDQAHVEVREIEVFGTDAGIVKTVTPRDPTRDEVIEYDYSSIPGYSSRKRIRIGVEANLLASDRAPMVSLATPADYGSHLPTLPAGFQVLGSVFNVAAPVSPTGASVNQLTMGLALPDNRPDWLSARFMKVYHYTGSSWEEMPIREITHEAVYFASAHFSPYFVAMTLSPEVAFVDSTVASSGDGRTAWSQAYKTLTEALNKASTDPSIKEIWVARGTYYPSLTPATETDRAKSFELLPNVKLFGGFPPHGLPARVRDKFSFPDVMVARVPQVYETILSGDLGVPANDGGGTRIGFDDNSYTVVKGADNAVLDGFVIRDGVAGTAAGASASVLSGAGMDNESASPTVRNCRFELNEANDPSNGNGGAIYNSGGAPKFENCAFENNRAGVNGGAVVNDNSKAEFSRCRFEGNRTDGNGGAIYNKGNDSAVVASSLFFNNAARQGSASYTDAGSPTFVNCTFTFNDNFEDGTVRSVSPGRSLIKNSILWGDEQGFCDSTPGGTTEILGPATVSYSIVSDGAEDGALSLGPDVTLGSGNKDSDPLFATNSGLGSLCFNSGFHVRPGSPAIDAASSADAAGAPGNLTGAARFDYPTTANSVAAAGPNYPDIGAFENVHDTDGDGLSDEWEINGVPGATSNVPGDPLYSDPLHRDMFLELDYMEGTAPAEKCVASGSQPEQCLKPSAGLVSDVVAAFAEAPLSNPDGSYGINLHVDVDDPVAYEATVDLTDPTAGETGRSDFTKAPGYVSRKNLTAAREHVYHYGLMMRTITRGANTIGGIGVTPGQEFVVGQGKNEDGFIGTVNGRKLIGASLMHELGHNLWLSHGGDEGDNYKPNYLSVMNYVFVTDKTSGYVPHASGNLLDYSRFYLDDLDEAALNEGTGLVEIGGNGFPGLSGYGTQVGSRSITDAGLSADWNNNGSIDTSLVSIDINKSSSTSALHGNWSDWDQLYYRGQFGTIGTSPASPFASLSMTRLTSTDQPTCGALTP